METYNENYAKKDQSLSRENRWVFELAMDDAATELYYFTSHGDVVGLSGANVFTGVLELKQVLTQKLNRRRNNSTVGSMKIELLDTDRVITNLFHNLLINNKALFKKRGRLWHGFKGLDFSDYIAFNTQWINRSINNDGVAYQISLADSQDEMNKTILQPLETRLAAAIGESSSSIPVYTTEGWELVQRDSTHTDAPNSAVTYIEISDNNQKEWCRVSAINAQDFSVARGQLGTSPKNWTIPNDANEERGPKVRELIFIHMDRAKATWAFLTGEDLDNPGVKLFPDHWHCGVSPDKFTRAQFVALKNVYKPYYRIALPKSNGKKWIETACLRDMFKFLRVNGEGKMDLIEAGPVGRDTSSVAVISDEDAWDFSDLTLDDSEIVNHVTINWSWDPLPKKAHYRRVNSFQLGDTDIVGSSIYLYGERREEVDLPLINGMEATTTTILGIANQYMERYAGPNAKCSAKIFPYLSRLQVGDIVQAASSSVFDFSTGTTLNRSMQILQKQVDRNGDITVSLFGNTHKAELITDGDTYNLTDSAYVRGTPLPNVVNGVLNAETTIDGVYYHLGDLTINANKLRFTQNAQLWVRGLITLSLQDGIDGAGAGTQTAQFLGTSVGGSGYRSTPIETSPGVWDYQTERLHPLIAEGEHSTAPIFDLDNENGTNILNLPINLRGSGGPDGGAHIVETLVPDIEVLDGADAVNGGAGLLIVSRGFIRTGQGSINLSGAPANPAPSMYSNAMGRNIWAGESGHGSPGCLLYLFDGSTSSIPQLQGYVKAQGQNEDLGIEAVRIQPVPKPRLPFPDETLEEPGIELQYSIDGSSNWHSPFVIGDLYFRQRVNGGAWSVAMRFIGADGADGSNGAPGADGVDGVDGQDALGSLPIPFSPGVVGGSGDFVFTLDQLTGGSTNVGEVRIQGSRFNHPDGTQRAVSNDSDVNTNYGEGRAGRFFLMWTDTPRATRFPSGSWGSSANIVAIRAVGNEWKAIDNQDAEHNLTIVASDCILAVVEAESTNSGLTAITPFVSGAAGLDGAPGADGQAGADGVAGPPGADGQTTYTWIKYADNASGGGMSDSPTGKTYIGLAYNKTTATESNTAADYAWSLIQGADGADGVQGPPGADGQTTYTWIKYADSDTGAGLSNDPTGKFYIGLAYNKTTATESNNASDYTWSLYRGADGADGLDGADGVQGPPGADGQTTYTWIKYADDAVGAGMSDNPAGKFYIGLAYNKSTASESTNAADYTWSQYRGVDGVDGSDAYTNLIDPGQWVVGANGTQGEFSRNGTSAESTIVLDVGPFGVSEPLWECISSEGAGTNGDGGWNNYSLTQASGKYHHTKTYRFVVWAMQDSNSGTKYLGCNNCNTLAGALNSNPYFFANDLPQNNKWYLIVGILHGSGYTGGDSGISGVYDSDSGEKVLSCTEFKARTDTPNQTHRAYYFYSSNTTDKLWFARPRVDEINGNEPSLADLIGRLAEDGVPGPPGEDGQTTYTWIKYADNAAGAGMSDNPAGKFYIGLAYNKTTATESNNAADYAWSLYRGADGADGQDGADGANGSSIEVQYSINGSSSWHSVFNPSNDLYMRQRIGAGAWSSAMRIVGEDGSNGAPGQDGADGSYFDFKFRNSASAPGTPSGNNPSGWLDSPPAKVAGQNLYMIRGKKDSAGNLQGAWSAPTQISGNDGSDGADGQDGLGSDPIINSTNSPLTGLTHISEGGGVSIRWSNNVSANGFSGSGDPPSGPVTFSLRRNGVEIDSVVKVATTYSEPGFWDWILSSNSRDILDTPGAGTHTYQVVEIGNDSNDTMQRNGEISTREER